MLNKVPGVTRNPINTKVGMWFASTEGIDQRAIDYWNMEEISIGDYILTGGEPAAMVLMDSVIRLLPAALGHETSATSFGSLYLVLPKD